MKYTELTAKQRKEIGEFPLFFAFNDAQLKKGLIKLNTTITDIYRIPGGGFYRKTDAGAFHAMIEHQDKEMATAKKNDTFLIDAIRYELGNHEYIVTYDPSDTISVLDLNMENERDARLFNIAKAEYLKWQYENN